MVDRAAEPLPLPAVVAHADWSVHPGKRWIAIATRGRDNGYRAAAPQPVGDLPQLLPALAARAGAEGSVLLGFDFPLGLPQRYADAIGVDSFRHFLARLGQGQWPNFFHVAAEPGEIAPERPFYPRRNKPKGEIKLAQLIDGLGLASEVELHRTCDQATTTRRAAAPLFWTMGPQQVGKAAIAAWRDLILPALACDPAPKLWPFDGPLTALLTPGATVIAETYPGEIYGHLGITFGPGGKGAQSARAGNAALLQDWAKRLGLLLEPAFKTALIDGFGGTTGGDDPFDATVGLIGMINILRGGRAPGDPADPVAQQIEGWILGQSLQEA